MGYVYLIHFNEKLHHAQHYIGYTDDLNARMDRHMAGLGSKLIKAVIEAGITFKIAKVWEGDRSLERSLKNKKKARLFCPCCAGERPTYVKS
jgi:predicted GIY-YIG superfamily endonuclease